MMSSSERSGYVAEWCPNCNTEIEMVWDVETLGYKAYCPVCGKRLMLCDACQHTPDGEYTDDCDYNTVKDTCKYNHNEEFEYLLKFAEESDLSVECAGSSLNRCGQRTASTETSMSIRSSTTLPAETFGKRLRKRTRPAGAILIASTTTSAGT